MTAFFDDLAEQVPDMRPGDIAAVVIVQEINPGGPKPKSADTPRQHAEDVQAIERIWFQREEATAP